MHCVWIHHRPADPVHDGHSTFPRVMQSTHRSNRDDDDLGAPPKDDPFWQQTYDINGRPGKQTSSSM